MPTRQEIRKLGQGIIASYDTRVAGVAQIREDTQGQLRDLARADSQRRRDVGTQCKGYNEAHAAMTRQFRADLSQVAPALHQVEARREREARQEIAHHKSEVNSQLQGYDQAHTAMAQELRVDLAGVAPALRQAEGQREREARQEIAERKSDVSAELQGYDQAHAAMAQELRAHLAQVAPALRQAEGQRERGARQQTARRKSDVSALLQGYGNEQAGARAAWQNLTVAMSAKRSAATAVAEPAPTPTAPPPAAEEEAVARAVVGAVTEELTALGDRVFQYLANHPDGTRLAEIEREFALARLQAARVVRHLMDEGKAEKRGLSYFAT